MASSSSSAPGNDQWSAGKYNNNASFVYSKAFTNAVVELLDPQPTVRLFRRLIRLSALADLTHLLYTTGSRPRSRLRFRRAHAGNSAPSSLHRRRRPIGEPPRQSPSQHGRLLRRLQPHPPRARWPRPLYPPRRAPRSVRRRLLLGCDALDEARSRGGGSGCLWSVEAGWEVC